MVPPFQNILLFIGEIEDNQGKGVIIQLELKDREYTLRALTTKEAQKWVKVLIQLRDSGVTEPSSPQKGGGDDSSVGSKGKSKKKSSKSAELRGTSVPAGAKEIGSAPVKSCCTIM